MLPDITQMADWLRDGADQTRKEAQHQVNRILTALEDVSTAVSRLEHVESRRIVTAVGPVGENLHVGQPREGYTWLIEGITTAGDSITDASIYVGAVLDRNLVWQTDTAITADPRLTPIWVPHSTPVVCIFTAGTGDGQVRLQVAEVRTDSGEMRGG